MNSISAARTGSIAMKAISQAPVLPASNTLPAASKTTNSTGTPSRRPSSRARSGVMPLGWPVVSSFCASTELPKLIAARSLPPGARSFRASALAVTVIPQASIAVAKPTHRRREIVIFEGPHVNGRSAPRGALRRGLGLRSPASPPSPWRACRGPSAAARRLRRTRHWRSPTGSPRRPARPRPTAFPFGRSISSMTISGTCGNLRIG